MYKTKSIYDLKFLFFKNGFASQIGYVFWKLCCFEGVRHHLLQLWILGFLNVRVKEVKFVGYVKGSKGTRVTIGEKNLMDKFDYWLTYHKHVKKKRWVDEEWVDDGWKRSKHATRSQKGLWILDIISQNRTFFFLTI